MVCSNWGVPLIALLLTACGGAKAHAKEARLPADVYVIAAHDMASSCQVHGTCDDFRTPSAAVIADFEGRLPALLEAKGRNDIAASIRVAYVRQYWAVARPGGLEIVGNFVCRSSAVHLPTPHSDFEPIPPEWLTKSPVAVDDAGVCHVGVTFPAAHPGAAVFVVG